MSQYLDFRCGPYRLLLAVDHVVEISDACSAASAAATVAGWRLWRGQSLPAVSLCAWLGQPKPERARQIVTKADDGALAIIDVDEVLGLAELAPQDFAAIAALAPGLAALVDGVVTATDGACLLRLRQPFAWRTASADPEPAS